DLEIAPPASRDQVRELRQVHGILLPDEFVEVVTNYSAAVTFRWSLYDVSRPERYDACATGGDSGAAPWSTDNLLWLSQRQSDVLERLEEIEAEFADDPPERIWHGKTFVIRAG